MHAAACLALAMVIMIHLMQAPAEPADKPNLDRDADTGFLYGAYVKVFGGPHTPKKLTDIVIFRPFEWVITDERIGAAATGTKVRDVFGGALTFEWESLYAFHWGTREFHEVGAAIYARWNRFPWNNYIRTTLAIGMGPSITDKAAHYEPKRGLRSKWLAQFNIELNFYLPGEPRWALILRIQHRSGIFSLINDVRGGSNFLTAGVRRQY